MFQRSEQYRQIYKTRWFTKWSKKEVLGDVALVNAVIEMDKGLVDADLGGCVYKKRIAAADRGKSAGLRTLLAFKVGNKAFFLYGFVKKQQDNINDKELKALRLLAAKLLQYSDKELDKAITAGELYEVETNE